MPRDGIHRMIGIGWSFLELSSIGWSMRTPILFATLLQGWSSVLSQRNINWNIMLRTMQGFHLHHSSYESLLS